MELTNSIIQLVVNSPNSMKNSYSRRSSLCIQEGIGRIITMHNPELPNERYELTLYGHTKNFQTFSPYENPGRGDPLFTNRLKKRGIERPILVCTKDGRIFFDLSLRHKGMTFPEFRHHKRTIPNHLRRFREMFDTLSEDAA